MTGDAAATHDSQADVQRSGDGSTPVPDPTVLTTEQLLRETSAERDYTNAQIEIVKERLRGMDRATSLLETTINRTPTEVQREVAHLKELHDERFRSVALQFLERDTRSERESRDNKVAVDAAFAAQKEAAAKQDESNQKAIDKSEKSTGDTIIKLGELFKSTTDSLALLMSDLKDRVGTVEATKIGRTEGAHERSTSTSSWIAFAGVVLLAISIIVVAFVAIHSNGTSGNASSTTPLVECLNASKQLIACP